MFGFVSKHKQKTKERILDSQESLPEYETRIWIWLKWELWDTNKNNKWVQPKEVKVNFYWGWWVFLLNIGWVSMTPYKYIGESSSTVLVACNSLISISQVTCLPTLLMFLKRENICDGFVNLWIYVHERLTNVPLGCNRIIVEQVAGTTGWEK